MSSVVMGSTQQSIPVICMTIPLLTRIFELVREDVANDVDLHFIIEQIIHESQEKGLLSMSSYDCIAKANHT